MSDLNAVPTPAQSSGDGLASAWEQVYALTLRASGAWDPQRARDLFRQINAIAIGAITLAREVREAAEETREGERVELARRDDESVDAWLDRTAFAIKLLAPAGGWRIAGLESLRHAEMTAEEARRLVYRSEGIEPPAPTPESGTEQA